MATASLLQNATPISQGAEAKVYKCFLHAPGQESVLLKHRFHKEYRHPSLDASITKARVAGEARALLKCLRSGVNVPGIRMVDAAEGVIGMNWIEGSSVRHLLPGGAEEDEDLGEDVDPLLEYGVSQGALMALIGSEIAKMHMADIIHGDLTTSNMILRHPSAQNTPNTSLVLIDFGLAYNSNLVEDKAVDLYVLERAFASTHPESEPLFASVLEAYGKKIGNEWGTIRRRLDEVRLRGRKRSMVG